MGNVRSFLLVQCCDFSTTQTTNTIIIKAVKLAHTSNKILRPGNTGAVTANKLFALNAITLIPIKAVNAMYDKAVPCSSSVTSFVRCAKIPPIAKGDTRVKAAHPKSISFVVENAIDIPVANILILPMAITAKSDGENNLAVMYPRNVAPVPRIVCRVNQYKPIWSGFKLKGLCLANSVVMMSRGGQVR